MKVDRIVIRRDEFGYFKVERDDLVSSKMCWEEMLGQIATLTHPEITRPRFSERTLEQETAENVRRWEPSTPVPKPICKKSDYCDKEDGHSGDCNDNLPF